MRELLGTIVLVLALTSIFGLSNINLCVHTAAKSHCTSGDKHLNAQPKEPAA